MRNPTYAFFLFALLIACSKDNDPVSTSDPKEDWYVVSSVDNQTWVIREPKSSQANVSYLIAGSERAIMFDTGTGENTGQNGSRMMYKVKELTDLPVTLLLSHFHFDHNQNVHEFDNIALPELPFLKDVVNNDVYEFSQADLFLGGFPKKIEVSEWFPLDKDIDLGNRSIRIISLPGHTDESVVIVNHNLKMAFTGDFLYNGALFAFDSKDLKTYLKSMDKFLSIIEDDYVLYGAHGTPVVTYQHLLESRSLINCIVNFDCYSEVETRVFEKDATVYRSSDGRASLVLVHPN